MILKPDWATWPRHYSTWLGVATILFDSVYVFTDALSLSPQTMVLINAAVPVAMKILQLLKQDIPLEPAVKQAMKENITEAPTATPVVAPTPTKISGQAAREYINREIKQEVAAQLAQVRKRKPTAPRTKALAAAFAPPGESTP